MNYRSQASKYVLVIIVPISISLSLLRFNSFQTGTWVDDAHYIVLAESITTGQGYRNINYPDAPAARAFPPGWPLLLSPLVALFPGNYIPLKILSFVFWLASIALMYRFFATQLKSPYLEILITLIILNPMLVGISVMVMSEAAYSFFAFLFLNLVNRLSVPKGKELFLIAAIAVVGLYSQLLRTLGLSLVLSFAIYLLVRRQLKKLSLVLAIIIMGLLPQFLINSQGGGSIITAANQGQYFGCATNAECTIGVKLGQISQNIQQYSNSMISNAVLPVFGEQLDRLLDRVGLGFVASLLNILILLTICVGFVVSFKLDSIAHIYACVYFLALLPFWDVNQGGAQARYLIPLIPFFVYFLLSATQKIAHLLPNKQKPMQYMGSITISFAILVLLVRNVEDIVDPIRNRITDISVGYSWINQNAPADAIVMASNPIPDYLYARRKTVPYPQAGLDIREYMVHQAVSYIVVSPKLQIPRTPQLEKSVELNLVPYLKANPNRFKLAYSNPEHNTTVYEVLVNSLP